MADADVDGNHIRSLILTLFYYYLPGLIESGRVYSAQPPLYRIIKSDNSSVYLLDDSELREYRQKHAKEKYTLNRFKGLGEMNPEQLGETTLDPRTRTLKRINLDEAKEVADTFEVLMGKEVLPRRQFIESNSDKIDIDNL
jgi:DNA gyrase subunit B